MYPHESSPAPRKGRALRRGLAWAAGVLLGLPVLLAGLVWWQQDRIIALVVGQASQRLAVLVRVGRIELSPWAHFPDVTLRLDSVTIQESCLGQRYRMAALRDLSATMGFWDVLRGEYHVKRLLVGPGWVRMRILPDGTPNYDILKKDMAAPGEAGRKPVHFDLSGIRADSVRYSFEDQRAGVAPVGLSLYLYKIDAGVAVADSLVHIQTRGDLLARRLTVGTRRYLDELPVRLDAEADLVPGRRLTLRPGGSYRLGQAQFGLGGQVRLDVRQGSLYDLSLMAKESSLKAIAVLLPPELRHTLNRYQSRGRLYFEARAVKRIAHTRYPKLTLSFGAREAEFTEPTQGLRFVRTSFAGALDVPEGDNLQAAALSLKGVTGSLDGRPFSAQVQVRNLDRPELSGRVSATLPLGLFADKLAQAQVYQPSGLCRLDVRFWQGRRGGGGAVEARGIQAEGSVDLQDLNFATGPRRLPFSGWSGGLSLTGENIVAQGLRGRIGRSDLELDGHFEGLLGYLTGKRPALGMEVALRSNLLDMDELLSAGQAAPAATAGGEAAAPPPAAGRERYRFAIAPGLRLRASCRVGQLRFRRFSPRAIQGELSIENRRARLSQVRFYETGGTVTCEGTLDAATPGRVSLQGHFTGTGVQMDSLFYVMEDFDQQTLRHTQIHGRLRTSGNVALVMDQTLDVDPKSVLADADISLTDGQLLFFEPAQALGRFIDKEELKNLQFSELQNHFTIRSGVLYIPQMEIKSNIIELGVEGSHTFNQDMDYRLRVPMRYITGAALGQTPKPGSTDGGNLYLTLKGRPGATKISYDLLAVRKKIGQDIQEEKKKFLDLFRKRKKDETTTAPPPQTQPPAQEKEKEPGFFDLD